MNDDINIYTGTLNYKGILFSFVFKDIELRLISPENKKYEVICDLLSEPRTNDICSITSHKIEEPYLIGNCNETEYDIDFIELSLLDLIHVEQIVYAMQLKQYKIDNKNIQLAINALFGCNILIKKINV